MKRIWEKNRYKNMTKIKKQAKQIVPFLYRTKQVIISLIE